MVESLIEVSTCKTLCTSVAYRVDILMDGWINKKSILGIRQVVQAGQAPGRCWVLAMVDGEDEMQVNCTGLDEVPYLCLISKVAIRQDNSTHHSPLP